MRALFLAVLGTLLFFAAPAGATAPHAVAAPSCSSTDDTNLLTEYANNLSNKTLTLPKGGCFAVDGTITIHNVSNEVINGNGATLKVPPQDVGGYEPVFQLNGDTNLTIENLHIVGGYDGVDNGGGGFEGDYGVVFEADSGVTLNNDTLSNIQGDFLYLSPPYDVSGSSALNTGITVENSQFTNNGYHGVTVEAVGCRSSATCNGLTVNHDTFTNVNVDAFDFEVDDYSTGFNCAICTLPQQFAQDYVTIENSAWVNWNGSDWLASLQGQTPGVQQLRLTINNNTLYGSGPLFEIQGTYTFYTSPRYLNAYMTVTNNRFASGDYLESYHGSNTVGMYIYGVAGLVMEHNSFPFCADTSACGPPVKYSLDLYDINYSVIADNDFSGALGTVQPQDYNTQNKYLYLCGNKYGKGKHGATCEAFVNQ